MKAAIFITSLFLFLGAEDNYIKISITHLANFSTIL